MDDGLHLVTGVSRWVAKISSIREVARPCLAHPRHTVEALPTTKATALSLSF
jgi:hypothetical protein